MLEGSHPIALIYRIYYKCMKTNLNIHALLKSPRDKTVLIQSNTNANIQVPKTISWRDIQLPTSWVSENESFPQKLQNDTIDLDYIQQYLNGTVRISFDQQRVVNPPMRIRELGVETSSQISKPCYSTQSNFDEEETSQGSPTQTNSEVGTPTDPALLVIFKDFEINFDRLYTEFKSKKNKQKRKDYYKYTTSKQERIVAHWEDFMEDSRIEINCFNYLENFYKKVNTITKTKRKKSDNIIASSSHPPLDSIIKDYKGSSIAASPFKLPTERAECKQIVEQINYTNQCLKTIGQQLDKIETKLDDGSKSTCSIPSSSNPSSSKIIEKPLIHLLEKRPKLSINQNQTIQKIEEILTKLTIKTEPESPQVTAITKNHTSAFSQDSPTSSDEEINQLQRQFSGLEINHLYKPPLPPPQIQLVLPKLSILDQPPLIYNMKKTI
ncbi:hypothetical protein RHMOL_Rhmol08G0174500 [Rhododendron molle]|uniref:Uncharacterized protein n=1 Tax=Rhododendron molle TaxID=49168 RepID=A0ACC0MPA0_RHOML|nr:hypothetical protein RHMOL_Rhmol08G0174500 [Rhododendron molle]